MRFLWIATWATLIAAVPAMALDCAPCASEIEAYRNQLVLKEKTVQLLGSNKRYLASLSSRQASKFLKVRSNMMMVLRKLDQIKLDTERVQDALVKKGCDGCAGENDHDQSPSS